MATLIQSKQIEGVVTASVIEGTFTVQSGSVNLEGASGVTGSFSGSFIGDGSQLTFGGTGLVSQSSQVDYNLITNSPTFIAGDNVTITSASSNITITSTDGVTSYSDLTNIPDNIFSGSLIAGSNVTITSGSGNITIQSTGTPTPAGTISSSAQISNLGFVTSTGTDSQTLSLNQVTNILTISNGNNVDLTSISGEGRISGSIWSTGSDYYFVQSNLQVTGGLDATSLTGSIDYSNLTNVPTLFSSSVQVISSLPDGVVSGSSQITDGSTILSGSIATQLPSGVVSGSTQITDGSNIVSGSVLRTLDGTTVLSGSIIDQLPDGVVSGSTQITDGSTLLSGSIATQLPSGVVSGSSQITDGSTIVSGSVLRTFDGTTVLSGSKTDISLLNTYTSSADSRLSSIEAATGSYLTSETDSQTLSISGDQLTISTGNTVTIPTGSTLPSGVVSGSSQITDGSGIFSSSAQLPSGIVSQSAQTIANLEGTNIFSGSLIPGSNVTITSGSGNITITAANDGTSDYTNLINVPSGIVSGSTQITDSSNIVSGSVLRTFDGTNVVSGSVLRTLDGTDVVSGSTQITDGSNLVSGSTQITDGSTILSGSITDQLPSGVVSGSSQITDGSTILSGSITDQLPSGVVSGSSQITDGSNIVSGSVLRTLDATNVVSESAQIITLLPDGVVSGSQQLPSGIVSQSAQTITNLEGTNVFSGSVIGGTNVTVVSGSGNITINSSAGASDFTTLTNVPDGLVSGSTQITDGSTILSGSITDQLPNGVVSGSSQITDSSNIVSGSVLRTFDGTNVVSGSVLRTFDGTNVVSGSVLRTLDGTTVLSGSITDQLPSGVVSGSSQITDGSTILSGSILPGEGITINSGSGDYLISSSFNGDRLVSNTDLPSGIYNNNFGTSGSVQSFLESVFFPNTAPSISTGNQTIQEFSGSSSEITTLVATDAEGQTLTFGTASGYTDDLVRVSSAGVMTLNALATSASFNTDSVGGAHGHLITVTAADTFDSITEKDIYIIVTPNEAPKFRETSVGGNVITSVTSNLNENSVNNALVKRVFFTDSEGDTITITTSSIDNDHFDVTVYSNYLDIRQNTGSLDYEQQTTYTFSITASDEHYENSQDSDSRTFLPITINVTDNLSPTVNNQVVGSIDENSSNGTLVGTVSVSDSEGDSVSAPSFVLHKLLLDGSTVASSSYGGTSQATDPHENPFEINSGNRQITRKNGVYLNSDLINSYEYRVKVKDNFNGLISSASVVTINIDDDTPATLTDNWSAGPYIKESELDGTTIKTTDYGSTQADYNSNQSGTFASSNSSISINSSGNLSLNVDLSGSLTSSGDTIDSTITFTNTFGTTTTDALSVSVVANEAPTISFTNQTGNLNTNLATTGTTMVSMSVSDTEGDTPFSASLTGTDASSLQLVYTNANSSSIGIQASTNLSAATYNYNVRITDDFGKSRDYTGRSFVISAADDGTLGGDTTSYIIESGEDGDSIRDASGFNAGNQSQMTVSYSPNYGSQVVQGSSWTSTNPAVSINTSGQLSLALDISGSATGSGDDIVSTIGFQDQYGNSGTGTVTVNVFANQAPTATFTNQSANFETDLATTGTTMVSMSISDTESDTPFSASLTGTDASSLQLVYVGATSASVGIQASTNLSAATYNYNVKVTDSFGKSTTYSGRSFTVTQSADYGKVFVYNVGNDNSGNNYNLALGIQSENSDVPPVATPYSNSGFLDAIINDDRLSNTSFTYSYGSTKTATLLDSGSGSDLHTVLRGLGSSGNISRSGTNAFVVIFPSGSDMGGIPTSTIDSYGGSNTGRYVLEVGTDGSAIDGTNTIESSDINQFDLVTSHLGYTTWFMVGPSNGVSSASSINLGLNAESGSGGV